MTSLLNILPYQKVVVRLVVSPTERWRTIRKMKHGLHPYRRKYRG